MQLFVYTKDEEPGTLIKQQQKKEKKKGKKIEHINEASAFHFRR